MFSPGMGLPGAGQARDNGPFKAGSPPYSEQLLPSESAHGAADGKTGSRRLFTLAGMLTFVWSKALRSPVA